MAGRRKSTKPSRRKASSKPPSTSKKERTDKTNSKNPVSKQDKSLVKAATDVMGLPAIPPPPPPKTLPKDYEPSLMQAVCDCIAVGLPLTDSLRLLGLSAAYRRWRKAAKPYIDDLIARAQSKFKYQNLIRITKAGDKYWAASAWLLERRFPSQFSIPGRGVKGGQVGPVNIMIVSSVPRPYDIGRRRGKAIGEPGTPPDEIEAERTEVLQVVSSVPRQQITEGDEEVEDGTDQD